MTPDIKMKDYYLQFIYNANKEKENITNDLNNVKLIKENAYKYIEDKIDYIKDTFNIDINKYKEFTDKEYNDKESLYFVFIKLRDKYKGNPVSIFIIQILKYCSIIKREHNIKNKLKLINAKCNITFKDYKNYLCDYYNKVHKCVINGMGYKFNGGIGTYIINYWKLDPKAMRIKPRIDYKATNIKKKELLDKGVKLYDEKEAAWYAARNIPYDGVDYRVYKTNTDWYEITFMNSKINKSNALEYKHTEYIANKYRGISYDKIVNEICKTEEDIYNLQMDIKYKLRLAIYKNPSKSLNLIRSVDQNKYNNRTNHC